MVYFGHPHATDTDARRAARTALELAERVSRRSALLEAQHGVTLDLRVGLHTGLVMLGPDGWPTGLTPGIALRLESLARSGSILMSEPARQVLGRYVHTEPAAAHPIVSRARPTATHRLLGERVSAIAQSSRLPMVGRQAELDQLRALWQGARAGASSAVLVTGEAGIGKSRLVREVRQLVHTVGPVRGIRCLPEQKNSALFPFFDLFRRQWGLADAASDSDAVARIEAALAEVSGERTSEIAIDNPELVLGIVCAWLGYPLPESLPPLQHSPQRQKQLLLAALSALIRQLGQREPLMLVVEDMHWADPTSLEFLGQFIAGLDSAGPRPDRGVLLLMTARPEFTCPWDASAIHPLALRGLAADAARALLGNLLGDKPVADDVIAAIVERTDGVPLFVEELTRTLLDTCALVERDGEYVLDNGFDAASVPASLRDLLTGRLDRQGPARDTAQLAAALGRAFDASLLLAVAVRDEATVQADLDALTAADLLIQQRRVQGSRYIFRHALIRDVAYDSMLRDARERTHAHIAEVLESEFSEFAENQPAELARHHAGARAFASAVTYIGRAAQQSVERSANAEALAHTENGFSWAAELVGAERAEAELRLNGTATQALMAARGWADNQVKAAVYRSRSLLEQLDSDEYRVPTLWSLFIYHYASGDRHRARDIVENLMDVVGGSGDAGLVVAATTLLGMSRFVDGDYVDARRTLQRVVDDYDPDRDRYHGVRFGLDSLAIAAPMLAQLRWFAGDTREASELVRRGVGWARGLDHIPSLAISLLYSSLAGHYAGDRAAVEAMTGEILAQSGEYGLPAYEGYAALLHGWATDDNTHAQPVLDALTAIGCNVALTMYGSVPADVEARQGDLDAAIARIDHCLALCEDNDEHYFESELYRRRAGYLLQRQHPGDDKAARESLAQAAELAHRQGWPRIEFRAMMTLVERLGQGEVYRERMENMMSQYPGLRSDLQSYEVEPTANRGGTR